MAAMMAARMVARLAGPLPVRLVGGIFAEGHVADILQGRSPAS